MIKRTAIRIARWFAADIDRVVGVAAVFCGLTAIWLSVTGG